MIRNRTLPFLGECYADEARPFSSQDVCNWLPSPAEKPGTLTPEMAQTPPGLSPFVQVSGINATKPVRGTYNCEGKLFTVIGNTLYQITNEGVALPIGTVPGITRTRFAHNQVTNGNQLVVVNGSAGYVLDTPTGVYSRITDPGYPGAITADFVDGYIVSIEPGRRFAFNSDLANAREYNTLDRFTSEYKPDLLVTQVVSNNELILLSETSGEVFYNSGAAQQPFRTKRVFFDKGCSGRCNAAVIDNSFVFHSSDGMFYLYEGGVPKRISTRPIEQAVAGLNWSQGFAEVWVDGGHSVVYWTFPGGHTWGWDASSGKWHRRASYGMDRWRANTLTKWTRSATGARDEWIAGDFQAGRLWRLDWYYQLEGHDEFVSEIVGVVLSDSQNPLTMPRLEVMLDTGQELTIPRDFPEQPTPPTITGSAPDGELGEAYAGFAYTLTGDGPLTVTLVSGVLPQGLEISTAGVINTDATTLVGVFPFTLKVTDRHGLSATHTDDIKIICAPGLIGASITDTLTIPDSHKSAYIYPLSNGNFGVAYAAEYVSVGEFYHLREYDSSLTQVGATVDVEWQGGGDTTYLWLRAVNEAGRVIAADESGGYCFLIDGGAYEGYYQPSYVNYTGWWYAESHFAPEYGGLVWLTDTDLYLGVRKTGSGDGGDVPPYVENTLFKFPLTGGANVAESKFVTSVGTTTNPRFWMTRARNENIYIITQDGNLQTYNKDLVLQSTAALTTPVTGSGDTLRGFGVDGDVLALVYSDGGTITGSGRIEFRNLFTGDLLQSISSLDFAGNQATRVLFTDDSCYVQCRNWVGRIEFTPPQCVLP